MATRVMVLLGTRKGLFVLESGPDRRDWALRGPYCETWPINHAIGDPATGTILAAGGNPWFGPAVWRSDDLCATLDALRRGVELRGRRAAGGCRLEPGSPMARALLTGVEPAGLFRSEDGGA